MHSLNTIISDNTWNFANLSFDMPNTIISRIQNIHIPLVNSSTDTPFWNNKVNGMLSTSSAYKLITHHSDNYCHPFPHKWIWKTTATKKIKHFLWLLVLNRLPTASLLYYRNITLSSKCSICQNSFEDLTHLSIHCRPASNVWTYFNIQSPTTDQINWLKKYFPFQRAYPSKSFYLHSP